jgi:hypothetical protein
VWVVYPIDLLPPNWWVVLAWVGLSAIGLIVQLRTTSATATRKRKDAK